MKGDGEPYVGIARRRIKALCPIAGIARLSMP
jgi:hypothetical protein